MKPKGQNPTATIKLAKHKQNSHLSQMTLAKWRERERENAKPARWGG